MSWEIAKAGEVLDVRDGTHDSPKYVSDGFPLVTSKNLKANGIDLSGVSYITPKDFEAINKRSKVDRGDILFAMIGTVGNPVLIDVEPEFAIKNVALFKFNDPKVYNKFFLYLLKSDYINFQLDAFSRGGTQKFVSLSNLRDLKIPLPPLPIQKKIAAVLEKADELRRKREEQIKRLDDLLQATFLDMFSDPVTNPKGWPVKVLEEIVSNDCPVSYGIVQPGDFVEDGVPVVRPVDLDNGAIQVSALKKIDPNISGKYPRSLLNGDELLLTVRGSIGAVYLTSNEFAGSNVTRGIVPLRFNERIANKEFVYCMFQTESFKGHLKKISKGATLVQLNINELRKVPIILPSVDKQKSFKDIFLSLTMSRSLLEKANAKIDNTFNSLMQRAFKGVLGLR
jgi:type I restriction enzyme S subunit